MTRYEKLLVKAEKLDIEVKEIDFGDYEECAYYCNNKILINNRLNENQKHGVLAEELGHHKKTYGDISDQKKLENRKQELVARREGYKFVLEPLDLAYAFKCGINTIYDIAELFQITEKELNEIIVDFRKQHGLGKNFDKYYIKFEPTLEVYEFFDNKYIY